MFSVQDLWTLLLTMCGGFVSISAAISIIIKAVNSAKKPNRTQDERLDKIEKRLDGYDMLFNNDDARLKFIEESSRVTQKALLALLDHGIDGNNIESMEKAKEALQEHLIER